MITIKKIHHVGIAVKNLEKSIGFWTGILGLPLKNIEEVPSHQVKVAFLNTGESDIELVARLDNDDLEKMNKTETFSGLDHLCLEVEDLEQTLIFLATRGVRLRNETPVTLPGRKIAFVDPIESDDVLLEFYELT